MSKKWWVIIIFVILLGCCCAFYYFFYNNSNNELCSDGQYVGDVYYFSSDKCSCPEGYYEECIYGVGPYEGNRSCHCEKKLTDEEFYNRKGF